jgi:hypothetical protein
MSEECRSLHYPPNDVIELHMRIHIRVVSLVVDGCQEIAYKPYEFLNREYFNSKRRCLQKNKYAPTRDDCILPIELVTRSISCSVESRSATKLEQCPPRQL